LDSQSRWYSPKRANENNRKIKEDDHVPKQPIQSSS
jgi:hypothetical protein